MHKQPLPIHYCQSVGVQEAEVSMWRSSSGRRNACGSCHSSTPPHRRHNSTPSPPSITSSSSPSLTPLLAQAPGHNLSVAFWDSTTLWLVQYLHISQWRGRSCVADTWSVVNAFGLLPGRCGVGLSSGNCSQGCRAHIYTVVCFKYIYPSTAHTAAAVAHVQMPFGLWCGPYPPDEGRLAAIREG